VAGDASALISRCESPRIEHSGQQGRPARGSVRTCGSGGCTGAPTTPSPISPDASTRSCGDGCCTTVRTTCGPDRVRTLRCPRREYHRSRDAARRTHPTGTCGGWSRQTPEGSFREPATATCAYDEIGRRRGSMQELMLSRRGSARQRGPAGHLRVRAGVCGNRDRRDRWRAGPKPFDGELVDDTGFIVDERTQPLRMLPSDELEWERLTSAAVEDEALPCCLHTERARSEGRAR
jgi:hypothetical protein